MVVLEIINVFFSNNNEKYINNQKNKLFQQKTTIIAITGSFGKSSCKEILRIFLEDDFVVKTTKSNYNTPIGVALSIEELCGNEDFFIAEFGARHEGDIQKLCELYPPSIGMITGVTNQHLGVFGSFTKIYNEKFCLAKSVQQLNGWCAFGNNYFARKMHNEFSGNKICADEIISVEQIWYSVSGVTFTLICNNEKKQVHSRLLGRQAVDNILLCANVAYKLGVQFETICKNVEKLVPIPHRFEYSYINGIHIVDDGYNGNEIGVKMALDCLKAFPKPLIVVSQGLVEMGSKSKDANERIGVEMSKIAQSVILCGQNKKYIKRGLLNAHYKGEIYICRNMKEIKKVLTKIAVKNATIYFQNDIPYYL